MVKMPANAGDTRDMGLIPGSGRSPGVGPGSIPGPGRSAGEGIGYPLQYSWAALVVQLVKMLVSFHLPT